MVNTEPPQDQLFWVRLSTVPASSHRFRSRTLRLADELRLLLQAASGSLVARRFELD